MAEPKRENKRHVKPPKGIDLDAIICLDMSHQWRLVEEVVSWRNGPLQGCPKRVKLCMVCGSIKMETISWRGYVMSREYRTDPVYLENSRKLANNVNERRAAYRRILIGRGPKEACERCGLVHESVDCPIDI